MDNQKHNGWHNYATWRIQLEYVEQEVINMIENDPGYFDNLNKFDIAEQLKDLVNQFIEDNSDAELVSGWAAAFVEDVDWYELAQAAIDTAAEARVDA